MITNYSKVFELGKWFWAKRYNEVGMLCGYFLAREDERSYKPLFGWGPT